MAAPQHLFVIFGATGDLSRRKLLPAFYAMQRRVPEERCVVLGVGNTELSDLEFRVRAGEALVDAGVPRSDVDAWCKDFLHYQAIGPGFEELAGRIRALEADHRLSGNRVFYLALPPPIMPETLDGLAAAGLNRGPGWTRIVVEKPFGRDLESARELNQKIHRAFDESQVFRIDHYLGKETVRNLLVFRFANSLFEGAWSRTQIEQVTITVAEQLGVEGRARYYDRAGVVRDMLQSHLLQVLTLVAMEPPARFEADAIRDEKVKVLKAIRALDPAKTVLGQY